MERTIHHNLYAIAIISFCIGILYGLRVNAEGADSIRSSTNSLIAGLHEEASCNEAKKQATDKIQLAAARVKLEDANEVAHKKAISTSVDIAAVNARRGQSIDELTALQTDIATARASLIDKKICVNQDAVEVVGDIKDLDKASDAISARIVTIGRAIGSATK